MNHGVTDDVVRGDQIFDVTDFRRFGYHADKQGVAGSIVLIQSILHELRQD